MNLNDQQKAVVNHKTGPCVVVACPGSGKTSTLVRRTVNLISSGIDPSTIVCITFTNKAATEMRSRIINALNNKKVGTYIGTFHAFCSMVLRQLGKHIGYDPYYSIFDDGDQKDFLIKILRQHGRDIKGENIDVKLLMYHVNTARELCEDDSQIEERFAYDETLHDIYNSYIDECRKNQVVDFSGLLSETIRLFETCPDVLKRVQSKIDYIQIDEMQDTNLAQFKLIQLLTGDKHNVLLVGDIDQSIYAFRGARYKNINDFIDKYNAKIYPLGKNYRSTPEIIKVADALICNNNSHMKIKLETDNNSGPSVKLLEYEVPDEYSIDIAKMIKTFINQEGYKGNEIAVLYRMNRLSLDIQDAFAQKSIPFVVIGGPSFFDKKEIKDSLSALRFLTNRNDILAYHRIASLFDGIGDATIGELESLAKANQLDIVSMSKNIMTYTSKAKVIKLANSIVPAFDFDYSAMGSGDALFELINRLNYKKYLDTVYGLDAVERKDNVDELINNATKFSEEKSKSIERYLQNIALITRSDKEDKENCVTLMSMHAAKGLEFDIVFVIGMEQDILPHSLAIVDNLNGDGLEEETRLCYVAFTRAKKHLITIYSKYRKERNSSGKIVLKSYRPSQFLYESGIKTEDFDKYKKYYYSRSPNKDAKNVEVEKKEDEDKE